MFYKEVYMKEQKNLYLYPVSSRGGFDSGNPYLRNLAKELGKYFRIINLEKPSGLGILPMFRYFRKTDIALFNWIENLPDRKAGSVQVFLLGILLFLYHISGKKIVWIMHNKISHTRKNAGKKRTVFKAMLRNADLIITHSSEGIQYGTQLNPQAGEKIFYLPHPVSPDKIRTHGDKPKYFDFLIWGSMMPYKGVDLFLKFLQREKLTHDYSLFIVGKFNSESYLREVKSLAGDKTTVEDRYPSMDELQDLADRARFVLFTYNNRSVLSSGALMDTLGMGTKIIGPHTGAFADLATEGIILSYQDFREIPGLVRKESGSHTLNHEKTKIFMKEHTWQKTGGKFMR